jgi:hypothetical protein
MWPKNRPVGNDNTALNREKSSPAYEAHDGDEGADDNDDDERDMDDGTAADHDNRG